jgi:hypothetical protein
MVGFPTSILLEVRCQRLPVPPGANGGGIVRIADPTILEDRAIVGTTTVSRAFLLEEVVTAVLHSLG